MSLHTDSRRNRMRLCLEESAMSISELKALFGISQAQVYRDLRVLRESGQQVAAVKIDGEVRYMVLV